MRVLWPALAFLACIPLSGQSRVEPRIISIHPFAGQSGKTFVATVRGTGLTGAVAAAVEKAPFSVAVSGFEPEPLKDSSGRNKVSVELVKLRVEVKEGGAAGRYPIRLITRHGISNSLPIYIVDSPVELESDGSHESPASAIAISSVPSVFAGRLSRRGEADYYSFRAEAGQTVTFTVTSGLPQTASAGSAATIANFDPALSIYHADGSWFDPKRLKRIAYNDEPVWVFGRPTDAHLVHRFDKAGEYLLRVEAFAGQGGPDYSYQLKIASGVKPADAPQPSLDWEERAWTRRLQADRLSQLAARGGKSAKETSIETYRGSVDATVFKLPGTIEGTLQNAGEVHRARFRVDQPADIALEIETPSSYPPFFNPIVRLVNESGEEVATNVFAGRGACSGAMTKSLQSKTIVPLRDSGEYTLEVRDATADLAGNDFQYRVQVRPQIPHIGQIRVDTDRVNLIPGEAKTIRVVFDREEDYRGALAISAESLPPGVSLAVGADFEPDKDPPSEVGKRERYIPRSERAVVILSAASDAAPADAPHSVKLVVRPLVDGKIGDILATKTIHLMVVPQP